MVASAYSLSKYIRAKLQASCVIVAMSLNLREK